MEQLTDLKAILHSKRANIYYLEKCRVMQKDGRVLYLTEAKDQNYYWNIPIANTTVILLGTGTSLTQAAMRMLSQTFLPYLWLLKFSKYLKGFLVSNGMNLC